MTSTPIIIPDTGLEAEEDPPTTVAGSMVPCEICEAMIPFGSYTRHLEACITNRLFSISFVINDRGRRVRHGADFNEEHQEPGLETLESEAEEEAIEEQHRAADNAAAVNDYIEELGRSPSNILTGASFNDFAQHLFRGYRPAAGTPGASNATNALSVVFVNLGQGVMGMTTPSEYELNMQLAERLGRIEVGVSDINAVSELLDSNTGCDPDAICPICQDTFLNIEEPRRRLRCAHVYCDSCITKWLGNHKKCPVCNVELEAPATH